MICLQISSYKRRARRQGFFLLPSLKTWMPQMNRFPPHTCGLALSLNKLGVIVYWCCGWAERLLGSAGHVVDVSFPPSRRSTFPPALFFSLGLLVHISLLCQFFFFLFLLLNLSPCTFSALSFHVMLARRPEMGWDENAKVRKEVKGWSKRCFCHFFWWSFCVLSWGGGKCCVLKRLVGSSSLTSSVFVSRQEASPQQSWAFTCC